MKTGLIPATVAYWGREMTHFRREGSRVAGFIGTPLLFWLLVGSGFGDLRWYFGGALLLSVIFTAVFSAMSVIEDRNSGFLTAALAAPAPRAALVLGKVLGGATLGVVQGLFFLICLPLAGIQPGWIGFGWIVLLLALASLSFTALGFWLAWHSKSSQGFHAVMNLVLMPLWMVSGALFPMDKAHAWMAMLMKANPITYTMTALQRAMQVPTPAMAPGLMTGIAVTAGMGVLCLFLALRSVPE